MRPVLGAGSIRFRRPVPPFKTVNVTTRIVGADDRWIYLEHKLIAGDIIYSTAVLKAAFINANGRVPTDDLLKAVGYSGDIPAMTDSLQVIHDADDALMKIAETSS